MRKLQTWLFLKHEEETRTDVAPFCELSEEQRMGRKDECCLHKFSVLRSIHEQDRDNNIIPGDENRHALH